MFALLLGAVADHDEFIVLGVHVLMAVLTSVLCVSAVYTLIRESQLGKTLNSRIRVNVQAVRSGSYSAGKVAGKIGART